jgi:hypothetical protein
VTATTSLTCSKATRLVALALEEVRTILEAEEPNYAAAEAVGSEAMPHLEILAKGSNEWLAARAVSFASRSNDPRAVGVLRWASQSPSPRVRTQAAHGARYLQTDEAAGVLSILMGDTDAGVRGIAVKSTASAFDRASLPASLAGALSRLADDDPDRSFVSCQRTRWPNPDTPGRAGVRSCRGAGRCGRPRSRQGCGSRRSAGRRRWVVRPNAFAAVLRPPTPEVLDPAGRADIGSPSRSKNTWPAIGSRSLV